MSSPALDRDWGALGRSMSPMVPPLEFELHDNVVEGTSTQRGTAAEYARQRIESKTGLKKPQDYNENHTSKIWYTIPNFLVNRSLRVTRIDEEGLVGPADRVVLLADDRYWSINKHVLCAMSAWFERHFGACKETRDSKVSCENFGICLL
jgi:hypothetical protein